jgi:ubiquinone/menaquinone biosynthesis C-methylase UbiE
MEEHPVAPFNATAAMERLNALYARHADSPTHRTIFREVYGADYPEEAVPFSYITMTLLRRMAQALAVGPGATLIDLGCGRGGPSLWVARETGASLVGVDLSSVAVEHAARRPTEFGVEGRARFEVGDLTALRFADGTFDAAMSVDVLWTVPNRLAALSEVARIVKPGARFVFTNWDRDLAPPGTPPPVNDHRPLLREAGFAIETYEDIPEAELQRRAIYERYVASQEALEHEMGAEAARALQFEARRALGLIDGVDYLRHSRRIFVVVRRR